MLTLNKESKDAYLTTLQQRLKDISNIANAEIPVYVVLTKMDRLYGFQAMYRKLTKEQIESVLGATFSGQGQNWAQELSAFWYSWCEHMNAAMPDMMLNDVLPEQRSQIFSFIRQISGAYERISSFLTELLNTGGKSALFFKGVYLTSALQNGKLGLCNSHKHIFVWNYSEIRYFLIRILRERVLFGIYFTKIG